MKKKDGESPSALLFRFSKKIKQSGVLKESRKRRFHTREIGRTRRHASALHRVAKRAEYEKKRKFGLL